MKNGIINVLIIGLIAVLIYFSIQGCFWLLNQASTVANTLGFLGMLLVITFTFYEVADLFKKFLNKN